MAKIHENHLDENVAKWFAIRTPYKREKIVLKRLQRQKICAYLPLQEVTRRYTRKIKHLTLPLLNCYVFVKITKKEYIKVLQVPDVVNFVKFSGDLIAIPEREILLMKQSVEGGYGEVDVIDKVDCQGQRVRLIRGGLLGAEGVLVRKESKSSFLVELTTIGVGLLLKVDKTMLTPI